MKNSMKYKQKKKQNQKTSQIVTFLPKVIFKWLVVT